MPSITVKNIPPELYAQLKRSAEVNRRSINNEIIVCLERVLHPAQRPVNELLAEAAAIRQLTARTPSTADELAIAKTAGRP
ncbi:MAG: hypothetical protein AMXMBFR4_31390 [Candidatus Hydrogenedentota bacterium]